MKPSVLQMVMMLLAAAALGSSKLDVNLRQVFDVIPQLNLSVFQTHFVEDLLHVKGKCGNEFFCKAKEVVLHTNLSNLVERENLDNYNVAERKFEENMNQFFKHHNVNCTVILKNMRPLNYSKHMPAFWNDVRNCIQHRNFHFYNST